MKQYVSAYRCPSWRRDIQGANGHDAHRANEPLRNLPAWMHRVDRGEGERGKSMGVDPDAEVRVGGKRTLKQIAEKANVSIATVSRVFDQRHAGKGVSAETRRRILDAAQGKAPRSRGRSTTVGIVVPSARHPVYAELVQRLIDRIHAQG